MFSVAMSALILESPESATMRHTQGITCKLAYAVFMKLILYGWLLCAIAGCAANKVDFTKAGTHVVILGTGQDAGVPQAGAFSHRGWEKPELRRFASSIAVVDGAKQYLFDCTPDFRQQHRLLYETTGNANIDGIFLTHAHIGHYAGLMFLGRESMGTNRIPVNAMPRMRSYLEDNGPWSLLVDLDNIELRNLANGKPVRLSDRLTVTPIQVPHRGEFSETVGFEIRGPKSAALYLPDIDSWRELDEAGVRIEDMIKRVDTAFIDATFYDGNELPGRDLSKIPHPFITTSLKRFGELPLSERNKIRFIHLNHSNPAQYKNSAAWRTIESAGMHVAERGIMVPLD